MLLISLFSVNEQDTLYQISVVLPENADPIWTFYTGTLRGLTEKWALPSIDIELILNLVLSECTGQRSVDLISATSGMSRSSTGNITLGVSETVEEAAAAAQGAKPSATSEMQRLLAQQKEARAKPSSISLEGDLQKVELSAVLQSLTLTKMTGRLELTGAQWWRRTLCSRGSAQPRYNRRQRRRQCPGRTFILAIRQLPPL